MKRLFGKCGHECSSCMVFNATLDGTKTIKAEAAFAINKALGRDYNWNEMHCKGCRSSDSEIIHISKDCPVRKCKVGKKHDYCSECKNYQCNNLIAIHSFILNDCKEAYGKIPDDLYKLVCCAYDNSDNNLKMIELSENIRVLASKNGAQIIGFAEIGDIQSSYKGNTFPTNLLDSYYSAISLGVEIPSDIIDNIINKPTKEYSECIPQINNKLNSIALSIVNYLKKDNYKADIIPASETLDWENYKGAISHKAVAYWAGLGWIGKNNLLITPQYGSRIRLVTVFTNAILNKDYPTVKNCNDCKKCIEYCPANAINDYQPLPSNAFANQFDVRKCANYIKSTFADLYNTRPYVCGLCIKACPYSN